MLPEQHTIVAKENHLAITTTIDALNEGRSIALDVKIFSEFENAHPMGPSQGKFIDACREKSVLPTTEICYA